VSEWATRRLKTVLKEAKDIVGTKSADYQLLSLTKGGVIIRDLSTGKGKFPSDFGTYKIVRDGQIIFCLFDIDETPRTVGLSHHDGMITGAYDVFNIVDANSRFVEYFFLAIDNVKGLKPYYTGLRKVVSIDKFLNIRIPLPPRVEQDQIVRYLDWKVSQVNRLINAKKKQIGLLQEQKRGIINAAVKEAIGKQQRLKTLVQDIAEKASPVGQFYIGMENVLSWQGKYIDTGATAEGDCKRFAKGDILFGKLRPYLAKVYIPEKDGVCSGEFLVLRGFTGFLKYLQYVLLAFDFIMLVDASTYGAKMPRANWGFIGNCEVLVPSLDEQKQIVEYIEKQCSNIDSLIAALGKEISLLHEYRTRLISDVVTGKLDVRGVAVPEFEAVEEAATEDEAQGEDEPTDTEEE
jgi:type I restriction enzyme S subunit